MAKSSKYIGTKELCKLTGISASEARKLANAKIINAHKAPKSGWRFLAEDVIAYFNIIEETVPEKVPVLECQDDLVILVKKNPGLKAAQLAELKNDTKSNVNRNLYIAKDKGLLRIDEAYRWYPVEKSEPDIDAQSIARDIIENTNDNLLILGKAGTGKTYFLDHVVKNTKKLIAVLAPSGIAAVKAGGVTIHSFFSI